MAYAGYRVALDDEPYTYASFCAWYGNAEAERIWQESPVSEEGCNAAPAHMAPTATEHGNPPHTQIAPAATEHPREQPRCITQSPCAVAMGA